MNSLKDRVKKLNLNGVIAHWPAYENQPWLESLIEVAVSILGPKNASTKK